MLEGVILKGIGGFYYIDTEAGVYECRARGIFRKEGIRPTVGDAVRISVLDEENKKGSLDEILPRRNELIRPRVANVDQAVIVFAAKSPNMNLDLLDRFLLLAEEQELDIVIVINKIDKDKKERYLEAAENVTELLEIEDRLNDTIEDIESSKAVLKSLDNRIDYTAISIYIGCKDITYKESYAQKVGDRMKEIFESCGDNLIDGFEWMLQALIVCLYSLPILFIVVRFFLFAINRKHSIKGLFQRRKKRNEESKNEIKTEE